MTQLGLAGMPRRLLSCTPTRLAAYEDCPRRYRMTYLDRPTPAKGLPWAHNSLGVSVHNALRLWWELPAARRTPAAAGALLETAWLTAGYRDDAQSDEWRAAARGWVEGYVATLDPAGDPAGLERTVSVPTARLALSGRVDRIDDRDGELVVVDYKTGRVPPAAADVRGSRSLALYALAVARTLRRACWRVELHHLPTGTVAAAVHDQASLHRHLRRAEDTAEEIVAATERLADGEPAGELFPPRTGPGCGLCDYRRHCPEGRVAAAAREPWSVLSAQPRR
ncbi:MAG: PD-(D/E)XK nuclease family protein [Actinomycetota bacterium]|nr:PD-(D/E)XK nuclease family protein [Actinomycetota bacterium]